MHGLGDCGFRAEGICTSPFIEIILFSNIIKTNKGGIISKRLPRKFMVGDRRGKGQSILVPGPWTIPNTMR